MHYLSEFSDFQYSGLSKDRGDAAGSTKILLNCQNSAARTLINKELTTFEHNNIIVFKMLVTDPNTGYLPPGIHSARWCDVANCFANNSHRARLMTGLLTACRELAAAGCMELLLNGSFVSDKVFPGDYDAAWETSGVDVNRLDPALLDFSNRRAAMKAKYFGDLFPASALAATGVLYRDFFMTDRNGIEKGIVLINLRSLP